MARIKARVLALVTVAAIAIGVASLYLWRADMLTAHAAQTDSTYVVQRGDSLFNIANRLNVDLEQLASANGLSINSTLNRKQILIVPTTATADVVPVSDEAVSDDEASSSDATVTATDTVTDTGTVTDTDTVSEEVTSEATEEVTEEAAPEETTEAARIVITAEATTYRVKAGDTLYSIAKRLGISASELAAANGLQLNTPLQRGQTLTLPGAAAVSTPLAPPPTVTGEATEEATPEATDEADTDIEEATAEPSEEVAAEPTEEATPEVAATEEITDSAEITNTEEATSTEEIIATEEEATEDVAPEATDEAATEEATEEATPEVTATEEITDSAEITSTEEATSTEEITATEEEATTDVAPEATDEADTEEAEDQTSEEAAPGGNILDTLVSAGNFTTFLALLDTSGLNETLTTEGPFTLFAPTDDAFAKLPTGTIEGLLASTPDDLSQILLYHILSGEVLSTSFPEGVTVATTAQGATITIAVTPAGILVNDALIITSDLKTTNGVIHTIDTVLLPTESTAAVPRGTAAQPALEAASLDAAFVIIAPANITTTVTPARLWAAPTTNLSILSPITRSGYHSPLQIIGLSNTFEGHVALNLTSADGTLLAHRMSIGGADSYAFFQTDLRFSIDEVTEATLSLHEIDTAEGSILNSQEITVTLLPGQRVIDVASPVAGQAACNPILISGYSNTFEANVVLTLQKPDGTIMAQLPTMGGTMGVYSDFTTELYYNVNEPTPLLLSIAESDASGRFNTIDETVIPFLLYPAHNAACY